MDNKTKKNSSQIPLTDLDYAGVIYEPSKDAKKYSKLNKNTKTTENITKQKIKKAPNFNYNLFIGFTVAAGILIFALIFILTYSSLADYFNFSVSKSDTSLDLSIENNDDSIVISDNYIEKTGYIKKIDYETGIFTFSDITDNKLYTLKSKSSSIFKDKYDNMLTISELKTGDVVDFSYKDNTLNYVLINKNSFTLENVSNINIDSNLNTLTVNNIKYNLSSNVLVEKNGENYEIANISSLDVLDIKGYNNTIYYIEQKKGTGVLKLQNKPNLNNSIIEIDRNILKSLDEIDSISLSEGKHKIIIRSDDSLSFIKEIEILSDTETVLDLAQIQNKSGVLLIQSNVTDYTLYINNNIETSREPLTLEYGTYTIRAEKEGYNPYETQISINSAQTTVNIQLEKIEKVGKMSISSTPDGAQVYVDNVLVGYTPITYTLAQGVHTVTLKKEGYNDFVLSSVTIGDEESSFNITMHQAATSTSGSTSTSTTTETTTSVS